MGGAALPQDYRNKERNNWTVYDWLYAINDGVTGEGASPADRQKIDSVKRVIANVAAYKAMLPGLTEQQLAADYGRRFRDLHRQISELAALPEGALRAEDRELLTDLEKGLTPQQFSAALNLAAASEAKRNPGAAGLQGVPDLGGKTKDLFEIPQPAPQPVPQPVPAPQPVPEPVRLVQPLANVINEPKKEERKAAQAPVARTTAVVVPDPKYGRDSVMQQYQLTAAQMERVLRMRESSGIEGTNPQFIAAAFDGICKTVAMQNIAALP